tara:strand:- start:320 stop:1210 length:891 start_codon:yes stop_codon:yes gene_type:complete
MNNQIFWLASYPKSGNTLLRFILISLFFTEDGIFNFKKSGFIGQFDKMPNIERNKNIFGKDYKNIGDINIFYKYIRELQSKKSLGFKEDFIFLKTHAGLFKIGENVFTTINNTRGIFYIIRDPRDVSISWSKHNGVSIDKSIEFMNNDYAYYKWTQISNDKKIYTEKTIPKSFMSSWEKHVISWTSIKWNVPIMILKYEDLVYDKVNTIYKIINFFEKKLNIHFKETSKKIDNILQSTDFETLKKYEEKKGFNEASEHNNFFSVGKKNQWKKKLNQSQIIKIEDKFIKTMRKFNYK